MRYDLSRISLPVGDGYPVLGDVPPVNAYTYYTNLCAPARTNCKGSPSFICQVALSNDPRFIYNMGSYRQFQPHPDGPAKGLVLNVTSVRGLCGDGTTYETLVTLNCDPTVENIQWGLYSFKPNGRYCDFIVDARSRWACPGGAQPVRSVVSANFVGARGDATPDMVVGVFNFQSGVLLAATVTIDISPGVVVDDVPDYCDMSAGRVVCSQEALVSTQFAVSFELEQNVREAFFDISVTAMNLTPDSVTSIRVKYPPSA